MLVTLANFHFILNCVLAVHVVKLLTEASINGNLRREFFQTTSQLKYAQLQ